ncbi:uncharacterized protein LOC127283890 [Leptopilina boulardi]|uniref:uncharacterized protein LOC127283890 n=1 Tax=Leptopilina boulardi TaxID=63433 RepID=UPI0021F62807|nr:uncharacterized protein LOC127283890 [Leptopilina boulardi]XP_051164960.1 uncharacterized protein LOC127283890 [Leptopilina boulardi]
MEDKKLLKLLAGELEKEKVIYDKTFSGIPRYGNRNRHVEEAFEKITKRIQEKDDSYFWLKAGGVEELWEKVRYNYSRLSRKESKSLNDSQFLETFSFLRNYIQNREKNQVVDSFLKNNFMFIL